MPIVQQGAINNTALIVPDLYVEIVPPSTVNLNGVPTNVLGIVGTASWGPVNQPVICGSMQDYATNFGPVMARTNDAGTAVAVAVLQGASNFRVVRVTDGTDVAATSVIETNGITLTAKYTGSLGDSLVATIAQGSKANTWRLTVAMPGINPEVYDNIAGTGSALWTAMAQAVNAGNSPLRGPSLLVNATAGASTSAPTAGTFAFTGGTDGVASITSAALIGQDGTSRTGMYALRGQGCSVATIADLADSTTWSTQEAFGLSEEIYMVSASPAGDTIASATAAKATAGIDSYAIKLMFGDWLYYLDTVNNVTRLVSPASYAAGELVSLSPEQSSLNKQILGIVASQKSGAPGSPITNTYASADLQALFQAGFDVICNPQPGGTYWGCRAGHNSSSNAAVYGDNYTRMTNYIASTLASGMGVYVGQVINLALFDNITGTLNSFLGNMQQQGLLGSDDGTLPFSVLCSAANNPQTETSLGYVTATVQIRYLAINEKFIVNIEGGQTVTVSQPSAAQ